MVDRFDENQIAWEKANRHFNSLKGDFAQAINSGEEFMPEEICRLIDPSSQNRLLHLLCNDGREIGFLSKKFGLSAVGVDFSPAAIQFAERLNSELELSNQFEVCDAFSFLRKQPNDIFDRCMITLGVLKWLEDLDRLFSEIERVMCGGLLLLWDFHPLVRCVDSDRCFVRDYLTTSQSTARPSGLSNYVFDPENYSMERSPNTIHECGWEPCPINVIEYSFGNLISAIGRRSLFKIVCFNEFDYSWEERCYSWQQEVAKRRFETKSGSIRIPATFVLAVEMTK